LLSLVGIEPAMGRDFVMEAGTDPLNGVLAHREERFEVIPPYFPIHF
jgi:hypothetical protein